MLLSLSFTIFTWMCCTWGTNCRFLVFITFQAAFYQNKSMKFFPLWQGGASVLCATRAAPPVAVPSTVVGYGSRSQVRLKNITTPLTAWPAFSVNTTLLLLPPHCAVRHRLLPSIPKPRSKPLSSSRDLWWETYALLTYTGICPNLYRATWYMSKPIPTHNLF